MDNPDALKVQRIAMAANAETSGISHIDRNQV
jgi:hypothetical protein